MCDSVLLADNDGGTTCGLKPLGRSIGVTSCAMQAIPGLGSGRRLRRCCRPRVGSGGRASAICARSSTPSSICCGPGVSGAPCRVNFHRARRCRAISIAGATMAPGTGSMPGWSPGPATSKAEPSHPAPALSTARACRRPKAAVRAGLTPANASRDASAISSPTPRGSCSPCGCTKPTSKILMAPFPCCARCGKPSPSWAISSPTASIAANSCSTPSPIADLGRSKSFSARPASKASNSCPGDGWWSAAWLGSAAADVSPRTSRPPSPAPLPGCSWPTSGSSPADLQEPDPSCFISSQTLRMRIFLNSIKTYLILRSAQGARLEGRTMRPALDRGGAVIERHRMLRLGEEQPALDDEAEGRARHRQRRGERPRVGGAEQRDHRQQRRQREPGDPGDGAQPDAVLARDLVAHLLQQVILLGVRQFEDLHPPASAEGGRAGDGTRGGGCVDKAPVGFLAAPRGDDREQGQERGADRPGHPKPDDQVEQEEPGHDPQREVVRHDPAIVPLVDRLQRGIDHAGAVDGAGGERRGEDPAQPDDPRGGAKEDPADRENRRRDKTRDRHHPFAR